MWEILPSSEGKKWNFPVQDHSYHQNKNADIQYHRFIFQYDTFWASPFVLLVDEVEIAKNPK